MADADMRPARLVEHDDALPELLASLLAEVPEYRGEVEPAESLNPPAERPLTEQTAPHVTRDQPAPTVPAWAAQGFRALLFRIGDYRFAMPLLLMHSVTLAPPKLTRVPGQPAWHRGVFRYRDLSVVVADLGGLIGVPAQCHSARYLLVVGDGDSALACDRIEDAVLVEKDAVRWPVTRSNAWLAGLLVGPMCALLDPQAISSEIRHG